MLAQVPSSASDTPLNASTVTASQPPIAALFGGAATLPRVWTPERRARASTLTRLLDGVVTRENLDADLDRLDAEGKLAEIEVIFSTWGMPLLTPKYLERMPRLQIVFYAAGSVQEFARPLLEGGATVVSAWQANAVPVAEFTLGQILLANKGYWANRDAYREKRSRLRGLPHGKGNYRETVALLGAGAIGRRVIELLKPFQLSIVVFDPFLPSSEAERLGVESVSLKEAFTRGYVVSNHLADNGGTRGLLTEELFGLLQTGATFINTGRGRTVDEAGFARVFASRTDLTALLDVTFPEPPLPDSPLWSLPNVHLTGHIAGSIGNEVGRMADWMLDEYERWRSGTPLHYAVTLEALERMA